MDRFTAATDRSERIEPPSLQRSKDPATERDKQKACQGSAYEHSPPSKDRVQSRTSKLDKNIISITARENSSKVWNQMPFEKRSRLAIFPWFLKHF